MRIKLISCEIFYREMCAAVARSVNKVDVTFLPKGLHDIGQAEMMPRLQQAIDDVDSDGYDAICMGYGLCNNGVIGLKAGNLPLVIPRAHDCLTLFFGSQLVYEKYFHEHPGTYFETSGWLERGGSWIEDGADGDCSSAGDRNSLQQMSIQHITGMDMSYSELVAQYGEENAKYLKETLCDVTRNYTAVTFVEMGIEPDDRFEQQAQKIAADHNWTFDKVAGDMGMIHRLLDGGWDSESFLTIETGQQVVARYDGQIIAAEASE